jgi:hypothetical protein
LGAIAEVLRKQYFKELGRTTMFAFYGLGALALLSELPAR